MSARLPFGAIPMLVELVARDFVDNHCPAKVLFGEEFVQRHDSPNRVVFMPSKRGDSFPMPQQIQAKGTTPQSVDDWQAAGGANPNPVRTRVVGVSVVLWGRGPEQSDPSRQRSADQAALDLLVNQVVLSLREVAAGNERFPKGVQSTELKDVRHGLSYQLEIDVEIPIVDVDFQPGFLSSDAFTYELEDATAEPTVEEIGSDANGNPTVIEQVQFTAGS